MAQQEPDIEPRLAELERELQGTLGVVAHALPEAGDGDVEGTVAYHAEHAFPAASTIKVFVLQTLLEHAAEGRLGLDDEVTLGAADQVTGSGILKDLTPGRRYTLLDLARLMITISDNTATNLLIDALGVPTVNASIDRHGWSGTHLAGLLQRPDLARAGDTRRSTTSPADLADAFTRLWRGELLPPPLTELAQSIYRKQQRTDQLGRYLPFDSYSTETGESALVIASKSGSIRGVRNDAGVIERGPSRYVLAVMTEGCPDLRFHPDNLGAVVVAKVSRLVYDRFGRPAGAQG